MSFGSGGGFGGYQSMGGGFMPENSPSNMDSSQSAKKKDKDPTAQSLIPVSAAMIHKAQLDKPAELFKFGNIELHQVTYVGVIREVQEAATNMMYKIDDMTGDSIIVRKWIDTEEHSNEVARRSQCREDTFVRVNGHVKLFQERRSLIAFTISPIKDFNEIPHHMLDVIYTFLMLTKGVPSFQAGGAMVAGMRTPGGSKAGEGGTEDPFGRGQNSGLKEAYQHVLEGIVACSDEQGMSADSLKQILTNMNEKQIREALEFLSNEGHIYSTIDEDHFRSTAM